MQEVENIDINNDVTLSSDADADATTPTPTTPNNVERENVLFKHDGKNSEAVEMEADDEISFDVDNDNAGICLLFIIFILYFQI